MVLLKKITSGILEKIAQLLQIEESQSQKVAITLNTDKDSSFGDLSCNAAMVLARELKKNPKEIAQSIINSISEDQNLSQYCEKLEIAGAGFINIFLKKETWTKITRELYQNKDNYFKNAISVEPKKYLLEFVSANPTGPLHLGHGRGAIVGDVIAKVLNFLGHTAKKEYYINDAGNQITNLGLSLKARCIQKLGESAELPEEGYHGQYLIELADKCVAEFGPDVVLANDEFFKKYATEKLLEIIKNDLEEYGVEFDSWFSELTLHRDGLIDRAIEILKSKDLVYEQDCALWFRSTLFGDDKDRVVRKRDGVLTYIASDIAYHKNKFDRGFQKLIDIFGQDHHSYVKRLQATMEAIGYNATDIEFILCQMVSLKQGDAALKMSKRAGTFVTLHDIVDVVGRDVARFFYLYRKPDAHLEFDLDVALKRTDENPVFYIQYAYVRIGSILEKAKAEVDLVNFNLEKLTSSEIESIIDLFGTNEVELIKKIVSLPTLLETISQTYGTHLLSYYLLELAGAFHNYYAKNKIIDTTNIPTTKSRLLLIVLVRQCMGLCLDFLGISKPSRM